MYVTVVQYTIYHSANSYLGTILLRCTLASITTSQPGEIHLERRPIFIPRQRGVLDDPQFNKR
jgi:hypothetical protein